VGYGGYGGYGGGVLEAGSSMRRHAEWGPMGSVGISDLEHAILQLVLLLVVVLVHADYAG
jgi:hypothetical protein